MGRPVNSKVKREETTPLNTKVNKEVFEAFKDYLGKYGHPMNVMLETFMKQYSNGKFKFKGDDITKFKDDGKEVDVLSTPVNKEIYLKFKMVCKVNGYFVKHVISAFMEKYSSGEYILEFRNIADMQREMLCTARIEDVEIIDMEETE